MPHAPSELHDAIGSPSMIYVEFHLTCGGDGVSRCLDIPPSLDLAAGEAVDGDLASPETLVTPPVTAM